jgi:hypothetical protein
VIQEASQETTYKTTTTTIFAPADTTIPATCKTATTPKQQDNAELTEDREEKQERRAEE